MTHVKAESHRAIRPASRARVCGAVLVLLAGAIVQADSEDEITRCARIPSVGDRIVCLEDALRRTDDPHAPASTETPETPGDEGSASASDAEFGLDESEKPSASPESIRVTVVAVEKNAYGKLRFITGGGQIWQQIDQRAPRYSEVPFPVEIRTAAAGSFFLEPLDDGIAVRVQRKR